MSFVIFHFSTVKSGKWKVQNPLPFARSDRSCLYVAQLNFEVPHDDPPHLMFPILPKIESFSSVLAEWQWRFFSAFRETISSKSDPPLLFENHFLFPLLKRDAKHLPALYNLLHLNVLRADHVTLRRLKSQRINIFGYSISL